MKAVSFLSVAFMAVSAIAAPLAPATNGLAPTVKELEGTVGSTVAQALGKVSQKEKRAISDAGSFLDAFKGAQSGVASPLASLKEITESVKSHDLSKADAVSQVKPQLAEVEAVLQTLVAELTGATGLDLSAAEVKSMVPMINGLVGEIISTVSDAVTVLGLRPQLVSIVSSVLRLVNKVLVLVVTLVSDLVPGIIAGLTPLLAGIGNGLLTPLLSPIAALLASLAA